MTTKMKVFLLAFFTVTAFIIVSLFKPIPQDIAYHRFADHRKIFAVPNFLNVISNLPFLFLGLYGFTKLKLPTAPPPVNCMYSVLLVGISLTGFGSAFYHYAPDNNSLVYDRLPMTIVFMAFLSLIIAAWINIRAASRLLVPLLLIGTGSVLYWHYTELKGLGDLRFYAFIQYFPLLLIPLIFLLFKAPAKNKGLPMLVGVIGWYIVAKLLETYDSSIYTFMHFVSGHSLKHIAAAMAAWYIVRFFEKKYTIIPNNKEEYV